ncbi:histidine kinase, partial [Salmonella enterica]|nr:histidine kinase [Salmonella enterica]
SKRRVAMEVAMVLGFGIIIAAPTLLKDFVDFVPYMVKMLIVCATAFIFNVHLLMPRYVFAGHYGRYAVGVVIMMLCTLGLMAALSGWDETCHHMPAALPEPTLGQKLQFRWLLPLVGMLFVSSLYSFYRKERDNKKREIDLTHQNIEFEMKFLKTQINPHFLFNALNNIYALSLIKSERTPDMILKLSDMLRFTLYDSESKKVKLRREIEYIGGFIEFQKLKTDSDLNIKVDASNCNEEFMIEPMLLIPFIENSFKHGNIDNPKKGWLQVEVKTLGPMLIFQVRNSMPSIAINKDVVGGIGVENVRKRLDILYPGRYEMKIEKTDTEFGVYLQIDTTSN